MYLQLKRAQSQCFDRVRTAPVVCQDEAPTGRTPSAPSAPITAGIRKSSIDGATSATKGSKVLAGCTCGSWPRRGSPGLLRVRFKRRDLALLWCHALRPATPMLENLFNKTTNSTAAHPLIKYQCCMRCCRFAEGALGFSSAILLLFCFRVSSGLSLSLWKYRK